MDLTTLATHYRVEVCHPETPDTWSHVHEAHDWETTRDLDQAQAYAGQVARDHLGSAVRIVAYRPAGPLVSRDR